MEIFRFQNDINVVIGMSRTWSALSLWTISLDCQHRRNVIMGDIQTVSYCQSRYYPEFNQLHFTIIIISYHLHFYLEIDGTLHNSHLPSL